MRSSSTRTHVPEQAHSPGVVQDACLIPPPYVSVYCATAGDWLQGPYVYALYAGYGFSKGDIGKLFIAGFGSSMFFGTVVGSLADKQCVSACQAWWGQPRTRGTTRVR